MYMETKLSQQRYAEEFKVQAVKQVLDRGHTLGTVF